MIPIQSLYLHVLNFPTVIYIMFATILLSSIILGIAIILLAVTILLRKNGKFPEGHIGKNKAMAERGIKCAATQDREAQKTNKK
jgi:hypothetical protein